MTEVQAQTTTTETTQETTGQQTESQRKYAGKYDSVDDLERGYTELQKALGSRGGNRVDIADPPVFEGGVGSILQKAGLSGDQIAAEWKENGGRLSDASYQALTKVGRSRQEVDDYIAGQHAKAQLQNYRRGEAIQNAYQTYGGEETVAAALEWAKSNIEPGERARIQKKLDDPDEVSDAIGIIMLRYQQKSGGRGGAVIRGGKPSPGGVQPFRTMDEMLQAKAEARKKYGDDSKDPEFLARLDATPKSMFR